MRTVWNDVLCTGDWCSGDHQAAAELSRLSGNQLCSSGRSQGGDGWTVQDGEQLVQALAQEEADIGGGLFVFMHACKSAAHASIS